MINLFIQWRKMPLESGVITTDIVGHRYRRYGRAPETQCGAFLRDVPRGFQIVHATECFT